MAPVELTDGAGADTTTCACAVATAGGTGVARAELLADGHAKLLRCAEMTAAPVLGPLKAEAAGPSPAGSGGDGPALGQLVKVLIG